MNLKITRQQSRLLSTGKTISVAKRLGFSILLILFTGMTLTAQTNFSSKPAHRSSAKLSPKKGYITINELTYGFGISTTNLPYSDSYLGFITIHGYQINKSFVVAGGTGIFIYNAGKVIPLFFDFQYRFNTTRMMTSYAFADGGLLFHVTDKEQGTNLFINPGIGVRHDFSRDLGGNLGIGIMIQQGTNRNSFVNLKLGITFKP